MTEEEATECPPRNGPRAPRRRAKPRSSPALAYNDAVRDILRADGRFNLGDDRSRDAVWEWDGVRWRRIPLVDRPVGRAADEPPFVEVEREDDLAVVR